MRLSILVPAFFLAGCASNTIADPPVVDMRGVDANKYNADLTECTQAVMGKFITVGQPISDCLEKRGYHVIFRRN